MRVVFVQREHVIHLLLLKTSPQISFASFPNSKMARSLNFLAASLRIMLKEEKHAKNLDEKKDVKLEGKRWQKVNVKEANNDDEDIVNKTMLEASLPKVSELTDKFDSLNDKLMKSVKAEIEDKLKTPLDCFMQVAMTLTTDQAQLRTDQVQLQTDHETTITTFVQVGEKTKTRFKDLENENVKLKANHCQDLFSGMGSKRLNCPVHQKEGSKKQKKKPGGG